MDTKSKDLQLQYEGFLQTPFLWNGKGVFDLQQFKNNSSKTSSYSDDNPQKLRLGKLVERFVSFDLQQQSSINIIAENIQIQQEKITLGELDCILTQNNNPIHLEIIYKFYLYDSSVGTTEIEHFIGPNRKDSLVEKLTKLKDKQLPLLYSNQCKEYLKSINIDISKVVQQVYFKAQLFVPLNNKSIELSTLNPDCIAGFYINQNKVAQFADCKFYIPNKHNWLVQPHTNINWLQMNDFTTKLHEFLSEQRAPLCWLKKTNGKMYKFFVVWWDC